ncbi:MAG: hypothetical protein GF320_18935 [Armatimonadia bacterium]|nr:hypothetical protein [Armatimonadia bacterium]
MLALLMALALGTPQTHVVEPEQRLVLDLGLEPSLAVSVSPHDRPLAIEAGLTDYPVGAILRLRPVGETPESVVSLRLAVATTGLQWLVPGVAYRDEWGRDARREDGQYRVPIELTMAPLIAAWDPLGEMAMALILLPDRPTAPGTVSLAAGADGLGLDHPLTELRLAVLSLPADTFRSAVGGIMAACYDLLDPPLIEADLTATEWALAANLAASVEASASGRYVGVPHAIDCATGEVATSAWLGWFTGRQVGSGLSLIRAGRHLGVNEWVDLGCRLIDSWIEISGPGVPSIWYDPTAEVGDREILGEARAHLRDMCEDHLSALVAYLMERERGREHPQWLAWAISLGEFLLGAQASDGSLALRYCSRGRVLLPETNRTIDAVPLWVALSEVTGDERYLEAAVAAGEHQWSAHDRRGIFRGGESDIPNVIDKAAAALSLQGYLRLHDATGDERWIEPARAAGDNLLTWIALWDLPLPAGEYPMWRADHSAAGFQRVSPDNHAFSFEMAYFTSELLRLAAITEEPRYGRAAELMQHNTKQVIDTTGTLGYARPGMCQELWHLRTGRGLGQHIGWVCQNQLASIQRVRVEYGVSDARRAGRVSRAAPEPSPRRAETHGLAVDRPEYLPLAAYTAFRPDPGGVGREEGWHLPSESADGWTVIPAWWPWGRSGVDLPRGFGWYRYEVDVPERWLDGDVRFACEGITDCDRVYVNGVLIGQSGLIPKYDGEFSTAFREHRSYPIPASLLREGRNTIAVECYADNPHVQGLQQRPFLERRQAEVN